MRKLTVGLATCFVDNYGACLQAYALQTKIEETGAECKIIQYTQPDGYRRFTLRGILKTNPIFLKVIEIAKYEPLMKYISKPRFQNFRKRYLKLTRRYATFEAVYAANMTFDAYVCGSDQIWNPRLFHGNDPIYMLDFVPTGKKRIAYAPSIGLSKIPEEYEQDFREKLNRFDYISVREVAGRKIVQALTDKEVKVVLDPTLLVNCDEWSRILTPPHITEPYIFCYLFGVRSYIGEFVEYVRKALGLKIVCIPYTEREKNPEYIQVYDAGPCEFLGLIKNASLVITDSFHATAFSINFNTPFYSLLRNEDTDEINMNSRIFSILELVGLRDRLVLPGVKYPFEIKAQVDFSNANQRLKEKREIDFEDLKHQLEDI